MDFHLEKRTEHGYGHGLATTVERARWIAIRDSDGKQIGTGRTRGEATASAEAFIAEVRLLRGTDA